MSGSKPARVFGRFRVSLRAGEFDGGEVALAAAEDEPAAVQQVVGAGEGFLVGDLGVVEVGAALLDGSAGAGAAGGQAGFDQQVDDLAEFGDRGLRDLGEGRGGGGGL